MSDDTKLSGNPFIKFDGTIPTWGVVLMLIGGASYLLNNDNDLNRRMTILEVKVEDAKIKTDQIALIASDVRLTKELLIRLEKQISPSATIVPVLPR